LRERGCVSLVKDEPDRGAERKDHTDEEREGVCRHGNISDPLFPPTDRVSLRSGFRLRAFF
jgi:hypothetical protein